MRIALLLAAAFVLRVYLVIQGGQYYWPDERLYRFSQTAAECLVSGDLECTAHALNRPEHVLFIVVGTIPGVVEQILGANSRIPAAFFATFSVAGLWLVWKIALALGGSDREAILASTLLACSSTWTYYSRHLLPYDVSMTFALMSLWLAVQRPGNWRRAAAAACVSSLAFLAYYGSWAIVAFVLCVGVCWKPRDLGDVVARGAAAAAGFLTPLLLLVIGSRLAGGDLLSQSVTFAGTVTQGSHREGWKLPFEYLWFAEHGLAVLWAVCVALAVLRLAWRDPRLQIPLGGVLVIYGLLVLASVGLNLFVVYGRTARQLVPFLCLVAAQQIHRMTLRPGGAHAVTGLMLIIAVQAAMNLSTPLRQVFPDRFKQEALAGVHDIDRNQLMFVYADHIYPRPHPVNVDGMSTLAKQPHPLQFEPYQYEGFTPDERYLLRTSDISMRLLVK